MTNYHEAAAATCKSDPTDTAREQIATIFNAAGRKDYDDYIHKQLAGDFAYVLAGLLIKDHPISNHVSALLTIAQRAIDDLRRYMFDNTPQRRVICAERLQADLDALVSTLGLEHRHSWPRKTWVSDKSDLTLAALEEAVASTLSKLDVTYYHEMNSVVRSAVFASQETLRTMLDDARDQRSRLREMETDLQWEERESEHWARKATLDGDLGKNPPIFLIDVVKDLQADKDRLEKDVARLTAELSQRHI